MTAFRSGLTIVGLFAIMTGVVSSIILLTIYAQQQQTNFVATLSGKNMVPPVNTPATGTAKFHLNPNGTLSYEVDLSNINGVIGAHIGTTNGTELAELANPYAGGSKSIFPTGQVNGMLSSGVITSDKLFGPLFGKNATDLVNSFKTKSVYVTVRTTQHQSGEIQGQVVPSS